AFGETTEGTKIEVDYYIVFAFDNDLFSRGEIFPLERRGDAIARFEAIASPAGPRSLPAIATLTSRATIAVSRFFEDWMADNWEGVSNDLARDLHWEDHRVGLSSTYVGHDAALDYLTTAHALAGRLRLVGLSYLAVRGERLAL